MSVIIVWASVCAIWVPGDSQEHYENLVEHLGLPDTLKIGGKEFRLIPIDLEIVL